MKKKKGIIIGIILALLVTIGIVGAIFGIPAYQNFQAYQSAENLLKEGKYEEAKTAFWELGEYKDSVEKIKDCDYQKAGAFLEKGKYDDAKNLYKELGEYKDCTEKMQACDYAKAEALLKQKKYEDAKVIFEKLGKYSKSKEKVNACDYGMAEELLEEKKYEDAKKIFKDLGEYEKSKEKVNACDYGIAESYLNNDNYEDANKIFKKLGKYKDSEEKYKACQYGIANNYFNESEYGKAKKIYKSLGSYKDCKKKLKNCDFLKNKKKAYDAYKDLLEEHSGNNEVYNCDYFLLCDVDKDGIEELFISAMLESGSWGATVYTYKNGKLKALFPTDSFSMYRCYYAAYENTGVIYCGMCDYAQCDSYYKMDSNGNVVEKASYVCIGESETYRIGSKEVSCSEYEEYKEGLIGNESSKDPSTENTYENREEAFRL